MKRRYYLRGLAVGILITTLILVIAGRDNRPLTDAEIKARALELGMVDGGDRKLSDIQTPEPEATSQAPEPESQVQESEAASQASESESQTPEPESQAQEPESQTPEPETPSQEPEQESQTPEPETTSQAQESEAPSQEPEPESQAQEPESQTPESEASSQEPEQESQPEAEAQPVTIQVKSGASSYTVSKDLAAAGLVASAEDFDDYLCRNGYAGKIHVGTYRILPGTGEQEIAEMIAK